MPQFPTTCWSMIHRASGEPAAGSRESMGELLRRYQQPMLLHLKFKGVPEHAAEDLVQDFMLDLLDKKLLSIADARKGKFRTLLLTALDRFAISRHRYENAAKRRPKDLQSLDAEETDRTSAAEPDPSAVFERAWALDVLAEALAMMKRECDDAGHDDRWTVFDCRMLGPLLGDRESVSYAELARRLGMPNEKAAMNALVTCKRQFERALRSVVRDYVTRSQDGRPAIADTDAAGTDPQAVQNSASRQFTEHYVQKSIDREIAELRASLASPASRESLFAAAEESVRIEDPLKREFWRRLTSRNGEAGAESAGEGLGDAYAAGSDIDEEDLAVCYQDLMNGDIRYLLGEAYGASGPLSQFLCGPEPATAVLQHLKEWASVQRLSNSNAVSCKMASAVYFTAIAAALSHDGTLLTGLESESLKAGLEWLAAQAWIDDETRSVAGRAQDRLAA